MERLTIRCGSCVGAVNPDDMGSQRILRKLADYEDAEEQGLLLRLPCKVGDTVYTVDWYWDCKYGNYCPEEDFNCGEFRCEHEVKKYFVKDTDFEIQMVYEIGKTVFLTKSEAEQVLKQMKGE